MTSIGVVGLGLIGGSLALAARRAGHDVLGWDSDAATREGAAGDGLTVSADLREAEIVVLAVPMPDLTAALRATMDSVSLPAAATITDVGSLKKPVAEAMGAIGRAGHYVGGHPMSGTERNGWPAASADLFIESAWVLCLSGGEDDEHLDRWLEVAAVCTDLGARVVAMTPDEHDAAMAMISGVPHLLALALSAAAARADPLIPALAAGSFADLTRVAGSSPTLLKALTEGNEVAVRAALHAVVEQLDGRWEDLIEAGHAARESLQRSAATDTRSPMTEVPMSSAGELLRLCGGGVVIETVDAQGRLIGYREPTRG